MNKRMNSMFFSGFQGRMEITPKSTLLLNIDYIFYCYAGSRTGGRVTFLSAGK
jgi:hypothetical protein